MTKSSQQSFLSTELQHQKRTRFHMHICRNDPFYLNLNPCCDMLEADSNSAARVCSFSQQISSGEKVGDGWKEAWFF